ncbi:hypothetical protein M0638_28200 [Roseomonas sp. NAR14]|uniref:Uncharacterized protein n=1 Tax=Roseomonas acroporae TaxID=2937791 RepID=A0A9X1YGF8_9PROT|nr:hypothetical protein [Roseomonas acroporae]MCK8788237.1 hypothetical protein [Roseomonas acroporae]
MAPTFPAGLVARLHILSDADAFRFVVCAAVPPVPAEPIETVPPGEVAVWLTHDVGVSWPDRAGLDLATETLHRGGRVMLGFENLADAMACKKRLAEGSVR